MTPATQLLVAWWPVVIMDPSHVCVGFIFLMQINWVVDSIDAWIFYLKQPVSRTPIGNHSISFNRETSSAFCRENSHGFNSAGYHTFYRVSSSYCRIFHRFLSPGVPDSSRFHTPDSTPRFHSFLTPVSYPGFLCPGNHSGFFTIPGSINHT